MADHRPGPGALTHRYGPGPAQVAELHRPGAEPRAVVVMVHGGFWRARYDRSLQHPVAADLLARGFAIWNVDYRGVGAGPQTGGGWPATFTDVAAAVDALAELAPDHGLPLDRVAAVGHSAGGALALWLAARGRLPEGAPGSAPRVRPGAVVAQAAVCDLVSGAQAGLGAGAVVDLMEVTPAADPERYRLASPTALLPLGVPLLVLTGTDDEDVPAGQSAEFARAAAALGDDVRLELVPGEGHFGHLDPASPLWRLAVDWLTGQVLG